MATQVMIKQQYYIKHTLADGFFGSVFGVDNFLIALFTNAGGVVLTFVKLIKAPEKKPSLSVNTGKPRIFYTYL